MDQENIEYDKKLAEMKKYLPVLENMESRLKSARGDVMGIQLSKIQGLKSLLLSNKRMKMENLLKCEQVLIKLHQKTHDNDINKENADRIITECNNKLIEQPPPASPINMNFYKENSDPVNAVTVDKPNTGNLHSKKSNLVNIVTTEEPDAGNFYKDISDSVKVTIDKPDTGNFYKEISDTVKVVTTDILNTDMSVTNTSLTKDLESIRPKLGIPITDAETTVTYNSPPKDLDSIRAKLKDVVAKCSPSGENVDTASKNITKLFEKEIELVTRAYIRDSNNPTNHLSSIADSFVHTNKCELFIKECQSAKPPKDLVDKLAYSKVFPSSNRNYTRILKSPVRFPNRNNSSNDLERRRSFFGPDLKQRRSRSKDKKLFPNRDSFKKNEYTSPSKSSFSENFDKKSRDRSLVQKDKNKDERSIDRRKYDKSYKDSTEDVFHDKYANKNRSKRHSSIEKIKELSELRKKREQLVQELQEENLFEALSDVADLPTAEIVKPKSKFDKEDGEIGESEDEEDNCIKMLYDNLPSVTKNSSLKKYLKFEEELKNLNAVKNKAITKKTSIKVPFEVSPEDSRNKLQNKTPNKIKIKFKEVEDSKKNEINSNKPFEKKCEEVSSEKINVVDSCSESKATTDHIKTPLISVGESNNSASQVAKEPKTVSLIDKMADIITSEISPVKSDQEKPSFAFVTQDDVSLTSRCEKRDASSKDNSKLNKPILSSPAKEQISEINFSDTKSSFQEVILKALADDTDTEMESKIFNTNPSFTKGDSTDTNNKLLTDNSFQSTISQKARRISLEKYKEKHCITTTVRLNDQLTDENIKKYADIVNRVFTAKEIERFNPIIKRAVESTLASSGLVFKKDDDKQINNPEILQCQTISSNCMGPEIHDITSTFQSKLLNPTSVESKNFAPNFNVSNINNERMAPLSSQDLNNLPPWVTPVHRNYDIVQQKVNMYSGPLMSMSPNIVDLLSPKSDDRMSIEMMNVNINSGGSEMQKMINYDMSYNQKRCDNEFIKNPPRPRVDFPVSANYKGKNPKPLLGYSMNKQNTPLRGSNLMSPVSNFDNGIIPSNISFIPNTGFSPQIKIPLLSIPNLHGNNNDRMFGPGQIYQENDPSFNDNMGCSSNTQMSFYGPGNYGNGMYPNMGNMNNDSIPINQSNGMHFDRDGRFNSEFGQNTSRGFSERNDSVGILQDPQMWRPSQREPSIGPSFKRASSVGRSLGQGQNVDFSYNRDADIQRPFRGVFQPSLHIDSCTPLQRGEDIDHSVNRNTKFQRAQSVGRFMDNQSEDQENRSQTFRRGQSVGRSRERINERSNYRAKSIGRLPDKDNRVSEFQRGRSVGRSEINNRSNDNFNRDKNINPHQRGRSTGRFVETDKSSRDRQFDEKREKYNKEINKINEDLKDVDERIKPYPNVQTQHSQVKLNDRSKNGTDFDKHGSVKDPRLRHLYDNKLEKSYETKSSRKSESRGSSRDEKTDRAKRPDPRRNRDGSIYEDRSHQGTNKHFDPRRSRGGTIYDDRNRRKDESKRRDSSERSTKKRHDKQRSPSHKDSGELVSSKSSMLNFKIPKIKKDGIEIAESIAPDILSIGKCDIDERKNICGTTNIPSKPSTVQPSTSDIPSKPSTVQPSTTDIPSEPSAVQPSTTDIPSEPPDVQPSTTESDCKTNEVECDISIVSDELQISHEEESVERTLRVRSKPKKDAKKEECLNSDLSNKRTLRDRSKLKKEPLLENDFGKGRCLRDRSKIKINYKMLNRVKDTEIVPAENDDTDINVESENVIKYPIQPTDTIISEEILIREPQLERNDDGAIKSAIENVPKQSSSSHEIEITEDTTQVPKVENMVNDSPEKQKTVDQMPYQKDTGFPPMSINIVEQNSSNLAVLSHNEKECKDYIEKSFADSSKTVNSDSDTITVGSGPKESDKKGISDINSLVEILKNKDKMMEFLALLNKSGEEISDKIKKKIEKLAELESDDEENADLLPAESKHGTTLLEPEAIKEQTIIDKQSCELTEKPDVTCQHSVELENEKINCIESPSEDIITSSCIETVKPKKKYSKGNRELDMLHEYNLGMFISQDVLKATGVRSCTLHSELPVHTDPEKKTNDFKRNLRKCRTDPKQIVSFKTKKKFKAKKVKKNAGQNPFVVIEKAKVDNYYPFSADSHNKIDSDETDVYEYEDENTQVQEYESYKQKPCPKSKKILHTTNNIAAVEPSHSKSDDILDTPQEVQKDDSPDKSSNDQQIKASKFRKCKLSMAPAILKNASESCDLGEEMNVSKTASDKINEGNVIENNDTKTQPILMLKTNRSDKSKKLVKPAHRKKKKFVWQTGIIRKKSVNRKKVKKTPSINFTDRTYHFSPDVLEYNCKLCSNYHGPDIVRHYKTDHPHSEVIISRLNPEQARNAIDESKQCPSAELQTNKFRQYRCRFCNRFFKVKQLRSVLDHIIQAHTGEYKTECSLCSKNKVSTCTSVCNKSSTLPPVYDSKSPVKGFVCSLCYYTQVSHENLKAHIALRHFEVECELIEINLTQSNARRRRSNAQERAELELRKSRASARFEIPEPVEKCDDSVSTCVSIRDIGDSPKKKDLLSPQNDDDESKRAENESTSGVSDGVFSASVQYSEPLPVPDPPDPIKLQTESDVNRIVFQIKKETNDKEHLAIDTESDVLPLVTIKKEKLPFDETSLTTEKRDETQSTLMKNALKDSSGNNLGNAMCSQIPLDQSRTRVQVGALRRTESGGNSEYLCFIDNCSFTSQFLLLFSRHIENQHSSDVWDGFCEMCGEKVSEIGNITGKYILALDHLIKVHVINNKYVAPTETENPAPESPSVKIKREITHVPKIQLRPMTDLLAPNEHNITRPFTDLFVSNEDTAVSSPTPARNESADTSRSAPDLLVSNENSDTTTNPIAELVTTDEHTGIPDDSNESGLCHLRIESVVSLNPKLIENQTASVGVTDVETPSTSVLTDDQTPEFPVSKNNSTSPETVVISRKGSVIQPKLTASNVEHLDRGKRMIKYNLKNDQLFKCSGYLCRYTSLNIDDFTLHLIQHEHSSDASIASIAWTGCIYCDFSSIIPHELAQHILEEHGACRFECPQCSYRAAAPVLVITHSLAVHRTKLSMIGEVHTHPDAGEGALIRGLLSKRACVKPFICTDESTLKVCGEAFYTIECFMRHLKIHSGKNWWCAECGTKDTLFTSGKLVQHFRAIHFFRLLTCSYCGQTFDAQTAALGHLAAHHASRRPLLYLRMTASNKFQNTQSHEDRVVLLNLDKTELYNNTVMTKSCRDQIVSKAYSKATPGLTPFEFNIIVTTEKKESENNPDITSNVATDVSSSQIAKGDSVRDFTTAELMLGRTSKSFSKISPNIKATLKQQATSELNPVIVTSLPSASKETDILPLTTLSSSVTVETPAVLTPVVSAMPEVLTQISVVSARPVSPLKVIVTPTPTMLPASPVKVPTISASSLTTQDNPAVSVISAVKRTSQLMKSNQTVKKQRLTVKNNATVESENSLPVADAIISLDSDDDVPLAVTKNVIDHANKMTATPDKQVNSSDAEKEVLKDGSAKYIEIILSDDETADSSSNTDSVLNSTSVANTTSLPKYQKTIGGAKCFTLMSEDDMMKLAKNTGLTGKNLFRCGNTLCKYSTMTSSDFKDHLRICENAKEANKLSCFHCNRKFKHNMGLMEHVRFHGTHRYQCNICLHCSYSAQAVINHMRKAHKTLVTQVVPVNPFKTNDDTDFYIVKSVENPNKIQRKKPGPKPRMMIAPVVAQQDSKYLKKNTFGPDEIDVLPLNPILTDEIYCKVCGFGTKVRSNMLRHLQMHTNEIAVPSVAPINPVPHLESNEMHFDKMTNLALSSNIDRPTMGRNVEKKEKTDNKSMVDIPNVPKFIPEKERFVCGSHSCLYISVDEMMLRHHWEALHREETVYHCTHCGEDVSEGNRALSTAHIAAHLRLHEENLSGCESCSFMHPQARCVERHSVEVHGRASSRNLRSPSALPMQGEMELRSWQCGLCPPRTTMVTFKSEMIDHCRTVHSMRNQYKCTQCAYNPSTRIGFERHFSDKHPGRQMDIFNVYFRGDNRDENVIDNSPIWWKQRKRASMFTEDNVSSQEATKVAEQPPTKKRKSSTESQENTSKNTEARILRNSQQSLIKNSQENVLKHSEEGILQNALMKITEVKTEVIEPPSTPSKQLPKICNSKGDQFVCAFCLKHFTKTSAEMEHHFYEELNYRKWACQICGYKSFSSSRVMEHSAEAHLRRDSQVQELCGDPKIEAWIKDCLLYQELSIDKYLNKLNSETVTNTIEQSHSAEISRTEINYLKSDDDSSSDESKLVIVETDKITPKPPSPSQSCSPNEPLPPNQPSSPIRAISSSQSSTPTKVISPSKQRDSQSKAKCPHCDFESTSGIRIHIMRHWKVKPLKCAYCEYSAIRKIELRPHITKMHPGQPYEAVRNVLPAVQEIVSLDRRRSANKTIESADTSVRPKSGPFAKSHMCLKCELSLNAEDIPEHEAVHRGDSEAKILLKRSIVYKCSTCMQLTPDIPSIIVHHEREHPSTELNYVMHKLGNPKTKRIFAQKVDKYACKYCSKKCERYADLISHHKSTHGSVLVYIQPLSVEVLDSTGEVKEAAERRTNECFIQGCDFLARSISELTVHIRSHYIVYSCDVCSLHFSKYSLYTIHKSTHVGALSSTMKHSFTSDSRLQDRLLQIFTMFKAMNPSGVGEYIDFVNNDEDDVQNIVPIQNSDSDCYIIPDSPTDSLKMKSNSRSARRAQVARKSTTYVGDLLIERAYHTVVDSNIPEAMPEFSFYGNKPASIDFKKITVEMTFLGSQRTFTVEKLSTIENLSPKVIVKDIHNKTCY